MKRSIVLVVLMAVILGTASLATAEPPFRIAWSHYTGWEPWQLASEKGILKKWSDKFGITIDLVLINDYMESINLYTGGRFDGCSMTNMDALTIPGVGGVDSTALIVGDFSNGNDGIVMKNGSKVSDLKGREVKLVELSVSHYLLARALSIEQMSERDLTLVNTSDSDIAAIFASDPNGVAVTWNPPLMQCRNVKGANLVFDSSGIPGEIIDLMVVRTNVSDKLKKALVGAWFETMKLMSSQGKEGKEAIQYMAKFAGGTEAEFRAQLRTTRMFYDAAEAAKFAEGPELQKTMDYVRNFCFDHGLFGQGAKSKDHVGIQFPDKSVMGDKNNVKLRFDSTYMRMATENKL
ncbi:MAG: lipid kinase [Desulfomonile tiedjei]|uniref:Lipid kinase n=1 Tax=Desulfomonile tiedjei TaxID=2358 RepID=A0A9D6Z536_9BACT|nr:lipid kinase [Desulfomonile tiedjei]